jgi:hypothetical protein
MNPMMAIGAIASMFSVGSSVIAQGINIHRELHPPQQQAQLQQQRSPAGFKLEVVMTTDGLRQLVCVQEKSK